MAVRKKKTGNRIQKTVKRATSDKSRATKLKVEYVDIDKLKMWDKNPRKNDDAVDSIIKSIERFGYTNPVLVSRKDNRVIAGHTRIKALKQIGETKIPVIFLDIKGADADLYAIFDNKSTENTPWDAPMLSELFADLSELGADISLTGFSPEEIANYNLSIGETEMPELPDGDRAPFQQMTFTLHDSQAEIIKKAIKKAIKNGDFTNYPNENSNGNALALIAEVYLGTS